LEVLSVLLQLMHGQPHVAYQHSCLLSPHEHNELLLLLLLLLLLVLL
jgi:hypothetical protein